MDSAVWPAPLMGLPAPLPTQKRPLPLQNASAPVGFAWRREGAAHGLPSLGGAVPTRGGGRFPPLHWRYAFCIDTKAGRHMGLHPQQESFRVLQGALSHAAQQPPSFWSSGVGEGLCATARGQAAAQPARFSPSPRRDKPHLPGCSLPYRGKLHSSPAKKEVEGEKAQNAESLPPPPRAA